jgi:hypothetical protein
VITLLVPIFVRSSGSVRRGVAVAVPVFPRTAE